jgi:hypothetical protein
MKRESLLTLEQKVNPQTYWHLTIDISRQHFRTSCYFENEEDDLVANEASLEIVMTQQIAHSLLMIETTYARALQNQSGERAFVRQRYREISLMWHRFLHLQFTIGETVSRDKRASSLDLHDLSQMRKRWRALYETNSSKQLRRLYDDSARLRSLQAKSLARILREESPLLIIMPIGVDKSLLFALLTSYEISEITIVIVLLISLRQNLARRCQKHDICCRE